MMRARVRSHRLRTACFARTLSASSSAGAWPRPIPAYEWTVVPPTLDAAIPVDAVTKTWSLPCMRRSTSITLRSVNDLPVPALP